jgi:hypothetical protein
MSAEMIARLRAAHNLEPGYHWVEIPTDIISGWIDCMLCGLPFVPGGKLLYDNMSQNGVCEDCGENGLNQLLGKSGKKDNLDLPF